MKVLSNILVIYFVIAIITGQIDPVNAKKKSKKKEKKEADIVHPNISSYKKPSEVLPEFYCATCLTLVQLLKTSLASKKSEIDVYDALESTCKFNPHDNAGGKEISLVVKNNEYKYKPTVIAGGCDIFLEGWE